MTTDEELRLRTSADEPCKMVGSLVFCEVQRWDLAWALSQIASLNEANETLATLYADATDKWKSAEAEIAALKALVAEKEGEVRELARYAQGALARAAKTLVTPSKDPHHE